MLNGSRSAKYSGVEKSTMATKLMKISLADIVKEAISAISITTLNSVQKQTTMTTFAI